MFPEVSPASDSLRMRRCEQAISDMADVRAAFDREGMRFETRVDFAISVSKLSAGEYAVADAIIRVYPNGVGGDSLTPLRADRAR